MKCTTVSKCQLRGFMKKREVNEVSRAGLATRCLTVPACLLLFAPLLRLAFCIVVFLQVFFPCLLLASGTSSSESLNRLSARGALNHFAPGSRQAQFRITRNWEQKWKFSRIIRISGHIRTSGYY